MATTKKPAPKKVVGKAKPATKKTVSKKAVASTASLTKDVKMQSFKVSRRDLPFLSTRITTQTIYWSILLVFILIMQVWILNIQLDVIGITDNITLQQQ